MYLCYICRMHHMSTTPMRFPVGIQSFAELRRGGYVYIDKTDAIKSLIDEGKYYFLSRPRRFGKSLLLSTIEAYFKGEKELFCGLALENYAKEVLPCPVLHLDLNNGLYQKEEDLNDVLKAHLSAWEKEYGIEPSTDILSLRFAKVIKEVSQLSGRKVVILVDEYDKPLLSVVENERREKAYRPVLKAFYSNLKSMDGFIEFAMLTGVARFSKVSVFSDLNNLRDISFESKYSAICGITEEELNANFGAGFEELAEVNGEDQDKIRRELKKLYDGYHFAASSPDIYNPFSVMSVFSKKNDG